MLTGGMDVSGNQDEGQYKFMGMVIGTQDSINHIVKKAELDRYSKGGMKQTRIRQKMISKLSFDGINNVAFCVLIDRERIITKIRSSKRGKLERSGANIYRIYNNSAFYHIKNQIAAFSNRHGHGYGDIQFQCDSDCERFAKENALQYTDAGTTHTLSDLVAWANKRQKKIHGVIEIDASKRIEEDMIKLLKK